MPRRETPEINGGSMADIAFLLLIFFLVTTTMDVDTGISRKLPPMPDEEQMKDEEVDIKKRNLFIVLINKDDRLLVQGELMEIRELRDKAKEFILNENNSEDLPVKEVTYIPEIGEAFPVSKGVISLQNDRGTSYGKYIQVQNELVAAYNEVRDDASFNRFGKAFDDLDEKQQDAIKKMYPQRLSEAEPKNIGDK
jgi:biopolymer transport protein ExbD